MESRQMDPISHVSKAETKEIEWLTTEMNL